ncbi:MAG TPA: hypothetical protein VK589_04920 [Chryseolinea sp.]|nr:hypothetical protein [Chryseolinea sp.]
MDFEAYLISKKIDSAEFLKAEPALWASWKVEFEQMHPASFTAQKLYLINPVRRKYLLPHTAKVVTPPAEKPAEQTSVSAPTPEQPVVKTPSGPKPVVPRPVFKPKPKTS